MTPVCCSAYSSSNRGGNTEEDSDLLGAASDSAGIEHCSGTGLAVHSACFVAAGDLLQDVKQRLGVSDDDEVRNAADHVNTE